MKLVREATGEQLKLQSASTIGVGGEARIYAVSEPPGFAAKIYHRPMPERAAKLRAMLANPPVDPLATKGRVSIAWPCELVLDADNEQRVAGFLMRRTIGMRPIIDVYHPKTRRHRNPLFNYQYLLRTARNLAACVSALHDRGYVIGDLNESNILVGQTALVTLVDTDSFQVPQPGTDIVYRCRVGKPEFTPPELQSVSFAWVDRKPEHDLFGLGVLFFQLLMEGTHPFSGRYTGEGEPPSLEFRIASGQFPHMTNQRGAFLPMAMSPPFEVLPPRLQLLFARCFVDGCKMPALRPAAREWQDALLESERGLVTCSANNQHRFGAHLKSCPWCERQRLLNGIDPFPSREMVRRNRHLQQVITPLRLRNPVQYGYNEAIRIARAAAARKRVENVVWPTFMGGIGLVLVILWVLIAFQARF